MVDFFTEKLVSPKASSNINARVEAFEPAIRAITADSSTVVSSRRDKRELWTMTRWAFIAVEIKEREFDSRLVVASELARHGVHVLIGRRADLQRAIRVLPPGVFLDTNLPVQNADSSVSLRLLSHRRERGIVNVCLDEEGLLYSDGGTYAAMRMSADTVRLTDFHVAWGKRQAGDIKRNYPSARVLTLGNPRVELWGAAGGTYGAQAATLKREFGDFILFPSSFPLALHAGGAKFVRGQVRAYGWEKDPEVRSFIEARMADAEQGLVDFVAAAQAAAEQGHRVIIRPHPADDVAAWKGMVKQIPNAIVRASGPATPWILASAAVVHRSCTTGLEAHLCGVPTFTLRPAQSPPSSPLDLPDAVSAPVWDPYMLPQTLSDWSGSATGDSRDWLGTFLERGDISKRIATLILEAAPETGQNRISREIALASVGAGGRGVRRNAWARQARRLAARLIPSSAYGGSHSARSYYRQKCPSLTAHEAASRLQLLLGSHAQPALRQIAPAIVEVSPELSLA